MPQQHLAETAEAAAKPTARKRIHRKAGPWNADVKAAVLQFWTEQGALLPEAEVQPEQQAEQRRMRSKILRWAAKYPRHRDLQFLTEYMTEAHDTAADSNWADEAWRFALYSHDAIYQRPASLLQRVQAAKHQLAQHGIRVARDVSLQIGLRSSVAAGNQAVEMMLALQHLPIRLDIMRVVEKAPNLMQMNNLGVVLERRVAAMQQLHPQLDVAHMCNQQPALLSFKEEKLAANWASLQLASGLGDDDMPALVHSNPGVLNRDVGVIGWKVRQVRAYEAARNPTAAGRTLVSGLTRILTAASFRVWRLCYLCEAKNYHYNPVTWVIMGEVDFAARNPGYSLWLASHPIPAAAYKD